MAKPQTRRTFLATAPLAAVALPLSDRLLHASAPIAAGQDAATPPHAPFQLFSAQDISGMLKTLQAAPGSKPLINGSGIGVSATLTVEGKKAAAAFEFHEHRDHMIQILEGSTRYLVGGTPKGAHQTGPGEWLAPDSEGFTTFEMKKGDILSLPRTTPHKRITDDSVSLILINGTSPTP